MSGRSRAAWCAVVRVRVRVGVRIRVRVGVRVRVRLGLGLGAPSCRSSRSHWSSLNRRKSMRRRMARAVPRMLRTLCLPVTNSCRLDQLKGALGVKMPRACSTEQLG